MEMTDKDLRHLWDESLEEGQQLLEAAGGIRQLFIAAGCK
jgi:hypothetical protein